MRDHLQCSYFFVSKVVGISGIQVLDDRLAMNLTGGTNHYTGMSRVLTLGGNFAQHVVDTEGCENATMSLGRVGHTMHMFVE